MKRQHLLPATVTAKAHNSGRLGFGFGDRFLKLVILGICWVVPAFRNRTFLYGLLAWDAVLLVAWAVDFMRLPRPNAIEVQRSWIGVAGIGCESQVTLRLSNSSPVRVSCSLQDDLPEAMLSPESEELHCVLPGNGAATVQYTLRSIKRGDHRIGQVYLRGQSTMRMAERWYAADVSQNVRIYPNLESAKRNTIYLTRMRQVQLEKRRLRLRGMGRDFESLRDYQETDELRDICWSATARRGKLVTKVYTVERSQPVWIIMDTGRLLRARVGELSKLDYAADTALSLAQLALYSGDKVGLLAYGRSVKHRVGLGRGLSHLGEIVEHLAMVDTEIPEADHLRAAGTLLALQKRRGLVVWLTDLAETAMTPEVIEGARLLLERNVVLFVVIGEPALQRKAVARPDSPIEMYETVAAVEMVQRRELLLARLRDQGAFALEVTPGELSTAVLNHYIMIKERSLL